MRRCRDQTETHGPVLQKNPYARWLIPVAYGVQTMNRNRTDLTGVSMTLLLLISAATAQAQSGGAYTVRKFVIAGGGGDPQGVPYRASVSVGQSAAVVSNGGGYRLVSGFHQAKSPGSSTDALFCSGFEDAPCASGANP
jgi:hypothetical protein